MKASIINQLSEFFSTQPVEKAWIFGSYARGEETSDSDLDIMVSYIPGKCPGILGICRIIDSLQTMLGIKVDLVERVCWLGWNMAPSFNHVFTSFMCQ